MKRGIWDFEEMRLKIKATQTKVPRATSQHLNISNLKAICSNREVPSAVKRGPVESQLNGSQTQNEGVT
jgi:hypothetical protein